MAKLAGEIAPPSVFLLAMEPRGLFSVAQLIAGAPLLAMAPRGTPQAVIVLPGLGATDRSTIAIRRYLKFLGYQGTGWNRGRNVRPAGADLPGVVAQIRSLRDATGTPVSLVGWSRDGIIAREAARLAPEAARMVVTLGSPFSAPGASNVGAVWRRLTGEAFPEHTQERMRALAAPLPVPSTSIYSRSDGVCGVAGVLADGRTSKRERGGARLAHRSWVQSCGALGHRGPVGATARRMDAVPPEPRGRSLISAERRTVFPAKRAP
ncbi:MAG TPA: alpha/beta hydrolase [Roseiarcus sp.]|nr:alpha/beta hydrolase [Roseiarcus sp.]